MKRNFSIFLVVATFTAGCAQDRNLDDYKKQQAQNDLAKLSAPAGRYSGQLTGLSGNLLGAMQMTLVARSIANANSDGTAGTAAASLVGTIEYQNGTTSLSFVTTTSNYDSSTGTYSATVVIPTTSSASATSGATASSGTPTATGSQTLVLSALIRGNLITNGTIQSATSSSNIVNFSLTKNGDPIGSLNAKIGNKAAAANPTANETVSYIGTTTFNTSGEIKPVQIQILKAAKRTAEDFLVLVNPAENVTVSLNYGPKASLVNPNATRDLSKNSLSGSANLPIPNPTNSAGALTNLIINLDCQYSNNDKTLTCQQFSTSSPDPSNTQTTGTGNAIAYTVANLVSNNQKMPVDTSTRISTTQIYPGYRSLEVTDSKTGKTITKKTSVVVAGVTTSRIDLSITYLPKSRNEELSDLFFTPGEESVEATLILFADARFPIAVSFPNTVWDQAAGTLSGTGTINNSSITATVTFDCSNFRSSPSTTANAAYSCNYHSNQSAVPVQFTGVTK